MKKSPQITLGSLRTMYRGKIFAIKEQDVVLPDGTKTVFEYCERPASVSVLAFNEKGELLMQKERRHGYKKNVWFLPGGRVDTTDKNPRQAALRELEEETGWRAKKMKLVHKKAPGATLLWDIFIFTATHLVPGTKHTDPSEHTEPFFVPFGKAVKMAKDGTIDNEFISYTILRFDYMRRHGEIEWR